MKLHPLSLPYRLLTRSMSLALTLFFVGTTLAGAVESISIGIVLVLVAAGLLVAGLWEVVYYRRFDYVLTDSSLDIDSGVISRRRREIPLRRIQNVDISRNIVQRVLGIALVGFETAGGGETEASLRFVAYDEARRLQREIQRRKRGVADRDEEEEIQPDVLYEIRSPELLLLSAISIEPRVFGLVFFIVPFFTGMNEAFGGLSFLFGLAQLLLSALVLWVASAMVTFARYYDFTLLRVDDELRYERGLLQRYDGSIPLDKIQTLTLQENPLMRLTGYATLSVETAGYAPGQGPSGGSEAAIPLATRERVLRLAHSIESFDDPTFTRPPKRTRRRYIVRYALVVAGLTGLAFAVDWFTGLFEFWYATLALLVLAPVAGQYQWKHRGYYAGENHVQTRNGFWRRRIHVVPYYRVQTVIQRETIFQRRWRLGTVFVDTASSVGFGGQEAHAADIDVNDAGEFRELVRRRLGRQIQERAGRARMRKTEPEQFSSE
ncbi:putative membrane protein [Haladaptatus litoreus]|uniref:Putative membrane protein n=1 Tax=Haladaptatus litoreus TaxID=553468 RepID=A0A1N6X232_9EURY|nr:PH domain-containing protein [Haladaptatus litoreus]SIQ96367.1 putative membrane protein [Haladaptatus litoreus]